MSEQDGAKPPIAWLNHLHEAHHWERLIKVASESLAVDPQDPETHRHIAWAYAATQRLPELARHVSFLLNADPDDARHHHLAAVYYLDAKRHKRAAPHIEALLQQAPNSATYHYLACIHALRCNKLKEAQVHIEEVRRLAPGWAPAARLQIRMDAIHGKKARDAWDRIHRLKKTLALDPQDAAIMTTIGEIFLNELERPREAEAFFRDALFIEPTNKERQALLLTAIRARSLLYRTLSLPMSAGRGFANAVEKGRLQWFVLLIAFKGVLLFIAWMIVVGAFFIPAAKVYEWLVLADISRTRPLPRWLRPIAPVFTWPLWLRMFIFLFVIVSIWTWFLWKVCGVSLTGVLLIISWIFGLHFALVILMVGLRRLRAGYGRWQDARLRRREADQALQTSIS